MENFEREVLYYRASDGTVPFLAWLDGLQDKKIKSKVDTRLALLEAGSLGQWRLVGAGVLELKIDFGPGYRIYLGQDGNRLVILLCGGNKATQVEDILDAHKFWADYRRRKKGLRS